MVSNGFLPGCELANDAWPGVCQSCVMTMLSNAAASRLMTGTTSAPPGTGSAPAMKPFCTSTTISAASLPGRIFAAVGDGAIAETPSAGATESGKPHRMRLLLRTARPRRIGAGRKTLYAGQAVQSRCARRRPLRQPAHHALVVRRYHPQRGQRLPQPCELPDQPEHLRRRVIGQQAAEPGPGHLALDPLHLPDDVADECDALAARQADEHDHRPGRMAG